MEMSEAKRQWVFKDLIQWAQWWDVPFQWPSVFPVRTVLPLRVALQDQRATAPLYRALWGESRDIGLREVVREVLQDAQLDADGLIEGTQAPQYKTTAFVRKPHRPMGFVECPLFRPMTTSSGVKTDCTFKGDDRRMATRFLILIILLWAPMGPAGAEEPPEAAVAWAAVFDGKLPQYKRISQQYSEPAPVGPGCTGTRRLQCVETRGMVSVGHP